MMLRILIVFVLLAVFGCKETTKSVKETSEISNETDISRTYPEIVAAIFDAHGGVKTWKSKRTMSYTMPKPGGDETQTIDLYTRQEKIVTPNFSTGFDGANIWLVDEKKMYQGDPIFYHNLMFYFYAMPFVLADEGINYDETKNLEYEGKSYPGIRISFDDGVGVSSKDEYFLHYNAETHQMAWLGYTVTYRSGEKSDKVRWIRYNDWQTIGGLVLPKSMTWHKVEDAKILEASSTRKFDHVELSDSPKSRDFYAVPENGKIVTKD